MKFDLISDFHVEMNVRYSDARTWKEGEPSFYAWHKARQSPILVMAGDLSNLSITSMAIVEEAADHYEHVIWCDGNHEHYSGYLDHTKHSLTQNMERFRVQANRDLENVTFLDGETWYRHEGTLFIGANGWYDFRAAASLHPKQQRREWHQHSNDPVCIRFGKKNRPEKLADTQAAMLVERVKEAQDDDQTKEIVVVTHTIPHLDATIKDVTHQWYNLNGAYMNMHMSKVWNADRKKKIKTWVFGHTHWLYDFFASDIRFVSNPRGYRGEMKWAKYTPTGMVHTGIKQIDTEEPDIGSVFGRPEKD